MTNSPRRPAHRPSRRGSVIDAAIGLFATYPAEAITVADIAAAANMTAAAVYYHFPSKERVLLEGLQSFARDYLVEVRRLSRETVDGTWIRTVVIEVLEWLEVHRLAATVYFARSSGLDMASRFGIAPEELASHPHALLGTVDGICETLQARRDELGISYLTIAQRNAEEFAPVVARLTGA